MSSTRLSLVFIEPDTALFRYLEIARRRFHTVVLTRDAARCESEERKACLDRGKSEESNIDTLLECDITSTDAMFDALKNSPTSVAGVLAGDDPFVPVAAALGRRFGFDYAPEADALAQQRKSSMKTRLAGAGVRTAQFRIVRSFEEATAAWHSLGRDTVVKMVDYFGSLNVSRVRSEDELQQAWNDIIQDRRQTPTPFPLAREAVIEEFIAGYELSIEGYVQDDRCVVLNFNDKITDRNFIVIGHYLPALVTEEQSRALTRIAGDCVRALGIRNSVFHIEVNLRDGLPYVIESASRPPGQYMVDLMERSYGIDLMEISMRLAVGERVEDGPRPPRRHYAMLALYAERTGIFSGISNWSEFERRSGVLQTRLRVKPGDHVVRLETFQDKYGFVILENETAEGVRADAEFFRANVRMNVAEDNYGSGDMSGSTKVARAVVESKAAGE
jgi:biotin carboxylase